MSTSTPGPWLSKHIPGRLFELTNAAGEIILRIRGGMFPCAADARVLAAAPEMRDTITALLALINRLDQDVNWGACRLRAETTQARKEQPDKARALLARIAGTEG